MRHLIPRAVDASIAGALAASLATALAGAQAPVAPPGTVAVAGGATHVGTTREEAEAVAAQSELDFAVLVYETPRHTRQVDDFFLSAFEVTNEQYEAFARATDREPPQSWGLGAIERAREVRTLEIAAQADRIRAAGGQPPDYPNFDAAQWWAANWRNEPWTVAPDDALRPVSYVSYADAEAYARWAGLRLPSEFEFQCAGRARRTARYPWGDEFDPAAASTSELIRDGARVIPDKPFAIGSFAAGATESGIHDLSGNVWEWTSSPFVPYPGYRDLKVEVGAGRLRRAIEPLPAWNAERRVVVGGCFLTGAFAARLTTRRPTDVDQATDSLGFRCAASTLRGLDSALAVLERDWPNSARPAGVRFAPRKLCAAVRWRSDAGEHEAPPGYAVIRDFDHVLFVPVEGLDVVSVATLEELSRRTGDVTLGILSTSLDMLEPRLSAGSYRVAFRSARAPSDAAEPPATRIDQLLFFDVGGKCVGVHPASGFEFARPPPPSIELLDAEMLKLNEEPLPVTQARLRIGVWVELSNRGLVFDLPLYFPRGAIDASWSY